MKQPEPLKLDRIGQGSGLAMHYSGLRPAGLEAR